ncbi:MULTISPECIES: hypothetical protein [unclassified Clostridium]|uniref:hypothetical protein n=1 Tax=unclassified Clostridium TaxID=2614128 RepID=UPI00029863B3|nr:MULTISPECIES: hypothetical protein [unclassified Clostridium]EKQ54535.1 MAG: hypothetical protein A370_03125 [Clostridium sp. Maddingley MBC34-26]
MDFVWVGFDKEININRVCSFIKEKFNLKECNEYDLARYEDFVEILRRLKIDTFMENDVSAFYEIRRNKSEFPLIIEFSSLKDLENEARIDIYLAYKLSIILQCKTITDGTYLGDDISEYWDIIFDKGEPFLADDSGTKFCDDRDGKIKIIRKMTFEELKLNR